MSETRGECAFRLDSFLKFVGAVGTGGEAKVRIQAGEVCVNDVVVTQRRRQLFAGDVVSCAGESFEVGEGKN